MGYICCSSPWDNDRATSTAFEWSKPTQILYQNLCWVSLPQIQQAFSVANNFYSTFGVLFCCHFDFIMYQNPIIYQIKTMIIMKYLFSMCLLNSSFGWGTRWANLFYLNWLKKMSLYYIMFIEILKPSILLWLKNFLLHWII